MSMNAFIILYIKNQNIFLSHFTPKLFINKYLFWKCNRRELEHYNQVGCFCVTQFRLWCIMNSTTISNGTMHHYNTKPMSFTNFNWYRNSNYFCHFKFSDYRFNLIALHAFFFSSASFASNITKLDLTCSYSIMKAANSHEHGVLALVQFNVQSFVNV